MKAFAVWISTTAPSVFVQTESKWLVPIVQSIHIAAISVIVGAILMTNLRLLGVAATDRGLGETARRFGAWQVGAFWVLLATGLVMLIGEPVRELTSFSFWAKLVLIAVGFAIAFALRTRLAREGDAAKAGAGLKGLAVVTLLVWAGVIVMGRLIAYDHLWGPLSPANWR